MAQNPELEPCCICEGTCRVRNILELHKRSPHGHGWGCVVCHLPDEGASAVICDECAKSEDAAEKLRFYCVPSGDSYVSGRAPISELDAQPKFEHDMKYHDEMSADR